MKMREENDTCRLCGYELNGCDSTMCPPCEEENESVLREMDSEEEFGNGIGEN